MKVLNLSAAAVLALSGAATLGIGAVPALAQAQAGGGTAASPGSKPNAYEGVSQPPSDDVISATEAPAAAPPPAAPVAATPATAPVATPAAAPAPTAQPIENPDYGIVESPAAAGTGNAAGNGPQLQARKIHDADADIVLSVPVRDNELPEGTPVHARMERQLSSAENGVGTPWTAQVSRDVVQNGRVIIPTGSVIHGRVTHADYGRRMYGPASLRLSPDDVVLPDGTRYTLHAAVSQTAKSSDTKVGREGLIESKEHPKRVAAEYAVGGGSGAVLGATVAGPAGAIAGTAIGVGVVTAHWLRTNHAAVLPAGSEITFGLTQAITLTPAQASNAAHP